ncbi:MAG: hypothetical protein ACRDJM_00585 [Actinomycetota bacterium]
MFLVALALVGCSGGGPRARTGDRLPYTTPQARETLSPGEPCPRPRGRSVHSDLGLAFGDGPVYAILTGAPQDTGVGLVRYGAAASNANGAAVKVLWVWDGRYNGGVLVRGRRIDAPGSIPIEAEPPAQAAGATVTFPGGEPLDRSGWHVWGSTARFGAAGCYAFLVDGIGFSSSIVFEAAP